MHMGGGGISRQTPLTSRQTPKMAIKAAGTHPTGMHPCFVITSVNTKTQKIEMIFSNLHTENLIMLNTPL